MQGESTARKPRQEKDVKKKGGTNRKEQEKEQTNEQKKKGARTSEKTDRTNKRENRQKEQVQEHENRKGKTNEKKDENNKTKTNEITREQQGKKTDETGRGQVVYSVCVGLLLLLCSCRVCRLVRFFVVCGGAFRLFGNTFSPLWELSLNIMGKNVNVFTEVNKQMTTQIKTQTKGKNQ